MLIYFRMRLVPNNYGWNRVERLVAELRAIEHWNTDYWRKGDPEAYETLAFVARRERRVEILSYLLTLIPRLTKEQGKLWITRKSTQRKEWGTGGELGFHGQPK